MYMYAIYIGPLHVHVCIRRAIYIYMYVSDPYMYMYAIYRPPTCTCMSFTDFMTFLTVTVHRSVAGVGLTLKNEPVETTLNIEPVHISTQLSHLCRHLGY